MNDQSSHESRPKHEDLVAQNSKANPSPNPFAHAANISVSVPETVEIKLVDASALADYEVWVLLASILSSALVGFVVAAIQAAGKPEQSTMVSTSVIWGLLIIVCALTAISKRKKLSAKAKRIKFAVGDPVE
ncbi:hypothetical protein FMZ60_11395 [Alcaligenaceae bacterium SJ-26]|nr:hypothetical protein FMZ60_11395 [Alcaligenaceae bacterium SJ-26]